MWFKQLGTQLAKIPRPHGILSAIDFLMDIERQPDHKADRVKVILSGKFLPYKTY